MTYKRKFIAGEDFSQGTKMLFLFHRKYHNVLVSQESGDRKEILVEFPPYILNHVTFPQNIVDGTLSCSSLSTDYNAMSVFGQSVSQRLK